MTNPTEQHPTPDEIELYELEDADLDALYEEPDLTCSECGGTGCDCWEPFMPCEHCDGMGYEWWR